MPRALCFGSLNLDQVYTVDHFVQAGETESSRRREIFPGGKGLNQALALARCGAAVWQAGCIGPEAEAGMLLETLREAGVDTGFVERKSEPTGHAIIQRNPQGENCILLFGGANQSIRPEQVRRVLKDFGPGDLLLLQNEINANAELLQEARRRGLMTALNPSPMDGRALALPLDTLDYLFVNAAEADQFLATAGLSGTAPEDRVPALRQLLPDCRILLTRGQAGAIYIDAEQICRQPSYAIKAVDTTGAGDTFTGYFLAARLEGLPLAECLDLAAAAAALAVSRPGAAPSIPLRSEVEAFRRRK